MITKVIRIYLVGTVNVSSKVYGSKYIICHSIPKTLTSSGARGKCIISERIHLVRTLNSEFYSNSSDVCRHISIWTEVSNVATVWLKQIVQQRLRFPDFQSLKVQKLTKTYCVAIASFDRPFPPWKRANAQICNIGNVGFPLRNCSVKHISQDAPDDIMKGLENVPLKPQRHFRGFRFKG